MFSIDSLHFKDDDWQFVEKLDGPTVQTVYENNSGDLLIKVFSPNPPDDLPHDYPDQDGLFAYFKGLLDASGGAVVSVDTLIVKGVEAFSTIIKIRADDNPRAMIYIGTLMFPTAEFFLGFRFHCREYGATGTREATVMAVDKEWQNSFKKQSPNVKSIGEWLQQSGKALQRFPSDDEMYDELFPTHPLSRCRSYLNHVRDTLEIVDDKVLDIPPYRFIAEV